MNRFCLWVLFCGLITSGFIASTPPASALDAERPCRGDVEKFCKGIKPGRGALARCMKDHQAELSAPCKAKHAEHKEKAQHAAEMCKADAQKFCSNIKAGQGRIKQCLKEHKDALSEQCRNEL